MPKKPASKAQKPLITEDQDLRARLDEAEETLRAIRSGDVDALVVPGAGGEQIFTLRGANHAYRMLIEEMGEGALTLSAEGVILYANRRFAEMLKTPLEKVIGSTIQTWIAPAGKNTIQSLLRKGGDHKRREELELTAGDGTQVPVYLSVSPLPIRETPDSLCVVATDLTEHRRIDGIIAAERSARELLAASDQSRRALLSVIEDQKRAEESLRDSERRFRALIENSGDAIALIGVDGKIVYRSPAAYRLVGQEPDSPRENSMFAGVHPDDAKEATQIFAQVLQAPDKPVLFQYRARHLDGSWRWVEGTATNLLMEPAVHAIVVNYRDVTERKRSEGERQALFEIMQGLATTESLQEVLELIRRSLAKVIYGENFFVVFHDKSTGLFEEVFAVDKYDAPMPPSRLEKSITSYVFRMGEALLLTEAMFEQLVARGEVELVGAKPAAWLGAPLKTLGETIGVIAVQSYEDPNCYSERDREFLASVGMQVSLAIQRKRAEARINRQLEQLASLGEIDRAIASTIDLRVSLSVLLAHVAKQLGVDAVAVLLLNPSLHVLEYTAARGFHTKAIETGQLRLGEGHAGRAALERRIVAVPDLKLQPDAPPLTTLLEREDFVSYYGVPLISKGNVQGVLELFQRSALEPDPEWLDLLNTMAGQAAIAIDNSRLFEGLQRSNVDLSLAYDATIAGWSHALDLRDKETEGHTERVTELSVNLARLFGLHDEELVHVRRGGLLHDMGKLGVPDGILLKPGPLTAEEWVTMRKHPTLAYDLLSPIRHLRSALDIPYCHHEKWDGTGYPRGLKGEQIPLVARIFAVIDVWDALISDRPYRKAWTKEQALEHIRAGAGTHFDPQVVKVFLESDGLRMT